MVMNTFMRRVLITLLAVAVLAAAGCQTGEKPPASPAPTSATGAQGAQSPGTSNNPASSSNDVAKRGVDQLSGADRDLYQRVISILSRDPDYNKLGYTDKQFQQLVSKGDCLVLAVSIRNPDVSRDGELLMLGRPQLQLVTEISAMEGYRGVLIQELSGNADLNSQLKDTADYIQKFIEVAQQFSWTGLIKAFADVGVNELVVKPITKELTNHAFNELYDGYRTQRENVNNSGAALANMDLVQGPYWQDWLKVTGYYIGLNDQAKLGWDSETINRQVEKYLEQRYRTEKGLGLDKWLVPVENVPKAVQQSPALAMENTIRQAMHELKVQLNKDLRRLTATCVEEEPPTPQPTVAKLSGRIYVGASPYQQPAEMTHGLFVITAVDGKWLQISPRAIDGVAISPDGSKLAAGMLQETGMGPGDPQLAIFDAIDPGYKLLRAVFRVLPWQNGPQQLTGPTWSSDNNTLIVSDVGALHIYDYAKDKGSRKIMSGWLSAWSPKDNRLVVAGNGLSMLDDARKGAFTYDPWTQETNVFETPRQGAVTPIAGVPNDASHPTWSPDGSRVLFISSGVLMSTTPAGGNATALTPADWKARAPAYSPDGSYIAFIRLEAAPNGGVWVMKADGTDKRQVVKTSFANVGKIDLTWGP